MTSYVCRVVRRSAKAFATERAVSSFSEVSKNQHGQNHGEHAVQDLRQGVVETLVFCRLQLNLQHDTVN